MQVTLTQNVFAASGFVGVPLSHPSEFIVRNEAFADIDHVTGSMFGSVKLYLTAYRASSVANFLSAFVITGG